MKLIALLVMPLFAGCLAEPAEAEQNGFRITEGGGPISVFLFEDYQCPHCRDYELGGSHERLRATWIETGNITLHIFPVAFIGEGSVHAARASLCMYDQAAAGWAEFHHAIFQAQGTPNRGWATAESMRAIATSHGADVTRLDACVADASVDAALAAYRHRMSMYEVTGTPGFVIAGTFIDGNDQGAVDAAIAQAIADGRMADGQPV